MNEITALETPVVSVLDDQDNSATQAVVEAVAEAKGVSPVELTPPLYSAIDTDALDQFVRSLSDRSATAQITFDYGGFEVSVAGDGSVSLDDGTTE